MRLRPMSFVGLHLVVVGPTPGSGGWEEPQTDGNSRETVSPRDDSFH